MSWKAEKLCHLPSPPELMSVSVCWTNWMSLLYFSFSSSSTKKSRCRTSSSSNLAVSSEIILLSWKTLRTWHKQAQAAKSILLGRKIDHSTEGPARIWKYLRQKYINRAHYEITTAPPYISSYSRSTRAVVHRWPAGKNVWCQNNQLEPWSFTYVAWFIAA